MALMCPAVQTYQPQGDHMSVSVVDLVIRDDEPPTEPDMHNDEVRRTKRDVSNGGSVSRLDMANNDSLDELDDEVRKLAELLAGIRWLNNEKASNTNQKDTVRDALVGCARDLANAISRRF